MKTAYPAGSVWYQVSQVSEAIPSINISTWLSEGARYDDKAPSSDDEQSYHFTSIAPVDARRTGESPVTLSASEITGTPRRMLNEEELAIELVIRSVRRKHDDKPKREKSDARGGSSDELEESHVIKNDQELAQLVGHHTQRPKRLLLGCQLTEGTAQLALQISNVCSLYVAPQRISTAVAAMFARIDTLTSLRVEGCAFDEDAFASLVSNESLRHLTASRSSVSDWMCASLVGNNSLKTLQLDHTSISDAGIASISQMKKLEGLSIRGCRAVGYGIIGLVDAEELKQLDLSGVRSGAGSLATLSSLPRLEGLDAGATECDDTVLAAFNRHGSLRTICIGQGKCTVTGVIHFMDANPEVLVWGCGLFVPFSRDGGAGSGD